MTRQRTPGRHRTPSRVLPLTAPRRAAAVALVAATGLASSHGPLSDAASSRPDITPTTVPVGGVRDVRTDTALAMLREIQPVMAREARKTRQLGSRLTAQAEAATAAATTRHEKDAAAALARRARHTRALARELVAQAEATAHGVTLVARFVDGTRPSGTVAQLAAQVRDAAAAEAFLFPLAVTAKTEAAAELAAARSALASARSSAAVTRAKARVSRATQDVELARLFVRVADVVRVQTQRVRAAHDAAVKAASSSTGRPTSDTATRPTPTPTSTPSPTSTPTPTATPVSTPSSAPNPVTSGTIHLPAGGASPVDVPTDLD